MIDAVAQPLGPVALRVDRELACVLAQIPNVERQDLRGPGGHCTLPA